MNNGCEQDPIDILEKVMETITETCEKLKTLHISPTTISAVGVTNQRETTVVWDKITGKPLYNALSKLLFFISEYNCKKCKHNKLIIFYSLDGYENTIYCR